MKALRVRDPKRLSHDPLPSTESPTNHRCSNTLRELELPTDRYIERRISHSSSSELPYLASYAFVRRLHRLFAYSACEQASQALPAIQSLRQSIVETGARIFVGVNEQARRFAAWAENLF